MGLLRSLGNKLKNELVMRKRINEVLAETIHEITAAKSKRNTKPNRQERKARRILREQQERTAQREERIAQREERERILMFHDASRTTAGKKRQGKGREIIATTTGRISYERQQRRTVSYSEFHSRKREEYEIKTIIKNVKI